MEKIFAYAKIMKIILYFLLENLVFAFTFRYDQCQFLLMVCRSHGSAFLLYWSAALVAGIEKL